MRRALACLVLASSAAACATSTPPYAASNATKMTEAAAFAGAAVVAQVVESAMEARARNNAPVRHGGGIGVNQGCDNEGQYPCATVSHSPGDPALVPASDPPMNEDDARAYVVAFINGVRKVNDLPPLTQDPLVDAFAQSATEDLSSGHKPGQYAIDHAAEIAPQHGEAQATEQVDGQRPLQERVGAILLGWMGEKPDGEHRGTLVRPEWRRVGVGIVTIENRTYVTVEFSS